MSGSVAIRVRDLGKCYHIYDRPRDRLKQTLWHGRRQFFREFWALKDVRFDVRKGEALGIIGRNGSGKSTLLQIIAGTLQPTQGEAEVFGRVAALLELGSGFNPEFTGRENVFLNATILGLTRNQTENRFDDIARFADIGDFLDQPVKTYSSGMMVRLAFAVQTAVEPEILIIDEALSVGDFFFSQKCAARMRQLRERGTTLLFVSHDMSSVRDLCEQAVYLKRGRAIFVGDCKKAIGLYFQENGEGAGNGEGNSHAAGATGMQVAGIQTSAAAVEEFKRQACWWRGEPGGVGKGGRLIGAGLFGANGDPTMKARIGDEMTLRVLFEALEDTELRVAVELKNRYGQIVNCTGCYNCGVEPARLNAGELAVFELRLVCMLEGGAYSFHAVLGSGRETAPNRGERLDSTPWLGPINIDWDYDRERAPFLGMFGLPAKAQFRQIEDVTSIRNADAETATTEPAAKKSEETHG